MNDMRLFACGVHVGVKDMLLFVILGSLVWWIPSEVVLVDTQLGPPVLSAFEVFLHLLGLNTYDVVSLPILDHVESL